jgi:hypothetical protein
MNAITDTDLEIIAQGVGQQLRNAKLQARLGVESILVGRTVGFTHREDDPADPDGVITTSVEAIVTGARWTYEDDILLEVTYLHPTTGETMVATRYML